MIIFNKLSAFTGPALLLLFSIVAAIVSAGLLATAQQTATIPTLTAEEQEQQDEIQDTIGVTS
jgi:hypothetical protein